MKKNLTDNEIKLITAFTIAAAIKITAIQGITYDQNEINKKMTLSKDEWFPKIMEVINKAIEITVRHECNKYAQFLLDISQNQQNQATK